MKNFGFGCMRLPQKNGTIDYDEFSKMVDRFLAEGFTYFDTAHGYHDGKSEIAVRECLTKRYPRESYLLTDKLSNEYFKKEEDIRPLFESQLKACGVEYFDNYLMHAQNAGYHKKYTACHAYEIARELKAEGKIKHIGISFHDSAEVLEKILTDRPEIELVQIQFNYLDYEDAGIQSRRCYEVCRKFGKPVNVMEPVKGGELVNLPPEANKIFEALHGGSNASYAIRFAASQEGINVVLSGMSSLAQLEDNLSYMKDFKPLTPAELDAVAKVRDIYRGMHLIPCTACHYCTAGCPKHIAIPDIFACLNQKKQFSNWNSDWYYMIHTQNAGKASDCIKCGQCERICPQHLPIRSLLEEAARTFEKGA